jgi:uncharacterized protein YbjT (DUF2867 family)
VVAASGMTGRHVVDHLVERGDRPIAIGRNPAKMAELFGKYDKKVEIRIAEMHDLPALTKALEGAEAVVTTCGLDVGFGMFSTDIYTTTATNVTTAMESLGIRRLVFMGTVATIVPGDKFAPSHEWMVSLLRPVLGRPISDQNEALEILRRHSDKVDWTYVRPGTLTDGPGGEELLAGVPGVSIGQPKPIARRDVAKFLVDQIAADTHVHDTPTITPK